MCYYPALSRSIEYIERYVGRVTLADYKRSLDLRCDMLSSAAHPVDVIVDFTAFPRMTFDVVPAARYAEAHVAPNQRLVILSNLHIILREFVRYAVRFAPHSTQYLHFADTLDDAYALIRLEAGRVYQ